eukprot:s1421_g20.t1
MQLGDKKEFETQCDDTKVAGVQLHKLRWQNICISRTLRAEQEKFLPGRVHDVINPRLIPMDENSPGWVSDAAQLLEPSERRKLNAICEQMQTLNVEATVVVLDALSSDVTSPSGFCAALLNFWGVGHPRLHTGMRLAMSHLLLRPIHVVTDRPGSDEALLVVEPPHQINQEAWGPPVIVAYTGWKHYEGTEQV